jgi:hypothetical protein
MLPCTFQASSTFFTGDWEIEDYKRQINYDELESFECQIVIRRLYLRHLYDPASGHWGATGVNQQDPVLTDLDGKLIIDGRPRHGARLGAYGARGNTTIVTNNNYVTNAELRYAEEHKLPIDWAHYAELFSSADLRPILSLFAGGTRYTYLRAPGARSCSSPSRGAPTSHAAQHERWVVPHGHSEENERENAVP